jgi:hypothetical protein
MSESDYQAKQALIAAVVERSGEWLAALQEARRTGRLTERKAEIAAAIDRESFPRPALSVGRFPAVLSAVRGDAAQDYLWLKYGSAGAPRSREEFASAAEAGAHYRGVPPRLVEFYRVRQDPPRRIDPGWLASYRLAVSREEVTFDMEMSGHSMLELVDPAAAGMFQAALGDSGPVLLLTSHLGYRRLRGLMGRTFVRDVAIAGASGSLTVANARQLALRAMRCLGGGGVLFVAPDGPHGEHRRPIDLRGCSIEISTGASRLAFETKARTVFLGVHYRGGMFTPHLTLGPSWTKGDTRQLFIEKVNAFYARCLQDILWGDPEQLLIPFGIYPVLKDSPADGPSAGMSTTTP